MKVGILPSERLCPDEDANYRFSFDEIILDIGIAEEVRVNKKNKR